MSTEADEFWAGLLLTYQRLDTEH